MQPMQRLQLYQDVFLMLQNIAVAVVKPKLANPEHFVCIIRILLSNANIILQQIQEGEEAEDRYG